MSVLRRRLVVKFGGSVLESGARIAEAARLVAEAPAAEKLVVVSAPLGMTDRLVTLVGGIPHPVDPSDRASVVAFGERIGARLFAAALKGRGIVTRLIEPEDPAWPIWTTGGSVDAEIDPRRSKASVSAGLAPLLRRSTVVLCGFLGREGDRVTTLRRGGSDTTAIALARFLGATDIVLVKDVPGVLTADPRLVPAARPLKEVTTSQLEELVRAGAKIVAPEALRLYDGRARLKVIPLGPPLLDSAGTWVRPDREGADAPSPAKRSGERSGTVTVVLSKAPDGLGVLWRAIAGRPWIDLRASPTALTVRVPEADVLPLLRELHDSGRFLAVTSRPSGPADDAGVREPSSLRHSRADRRRAPGTSAPSSAHADPNPRRVRASAPARPRGGRRR
ncbi:MAG TPA: hypothetical protein VGV64_02935 [Thermoplasmata archaeon]|nr:hypothetical protein [Thermoplasmata archaeon]HEV2428786.1 hypothetical protein [Thermoplasmata archaeon]